MEKKARSNAQWDKLFSTFYWKINLTETENTVIYLNGYSKVLNQSEAQDKDYLLKSKIIMFYKYGYLKRERIKNIEIYQRTDDMINQKLDPNIIILYPTGYTIPVQNEVVIVRKFGYFLEQFYKGIEQGKNVLELIQSKKKPVNKDDFLNYNRINFRNVQHLYSYSIRLLANGHSNGEVNHFINEVKMKYRWE